ncbi:MAG TPA: sensor histidine kinase, partial [Mesotoga sp.]|nr:sensor histidine kinase [Mesotoga sp.]
MAFNSVVLLVVILSVSALFIYRVSESVFIRNYSEEMRKIFMDSPMGRGMRMGIGRIIGRGGTEFYVRIEGIVVQNPNGLSNVPDVEGYMKTRIGGSSYLFYGFTNGNDKILLGAQKSRSSIC